MSTSPDYPRIAAERGRIFDTTAARYVWRMPYYPQYYIPLADVVPEALCDDEHPYETPLPAVAPIARLVAFYNEKVDITVDGVRLARPQTHFG
jgi:uncharacterized protein (DUF427 family)